MTMTSRRVALVGGGSSRLAAASALLMLLLTMGAVSLASADAAEQQQQHQHGVGSFSGNYPFVARGGRVPGFGGQPARDEWNERYGDVVEDQAKLPRPSKEEVKKMLDMEAALLGPEIANSNYVHGKPIGPYEARQLAKEALREVAESPTSLVDDLRRELERITSSGAQAVEEEDNEEYYFGSTEDRDVHELQEDHVELEEATHVDRSSRGLASRLWDRFKSVQKGKGGGGKGSSPGTTTNGLSTGTGTYGGAGSLTALLTAEAPGVYCLRSSTREVYEAFHCSGAFTPEVRQRAGGVKALVLDAEANPCCKQAVAQCRGDDGKFPMNPSYYTSSWLQGASGRRLSPEDPTDLDDAKDDEFVFIDERDLKGSKGGGSYRARSSKGSKGTNGHYSGPPAPPGPSPPGPPGPSSPSPWVNSVGGQSTGRRGYKMIAQPRSPRQPPAYLLPRGSPACQRKRVRCAGSSTTSARAGESDSRDVRARAKARRYEDSGDDGSKGTRFLVDVSEGVQDFMDTELAEDGGAEDARRLARNGAVVLIRADDYPDPWIETVKDSRCAEIEAYRCAGDDDDTPLRGKTGGFLMKVVSRARRGQTKQITAKVVGQSDSKHGGGRALQDSKGYAGGDEATVTGQSVSMTTKAAKERAQFAGYYYISDVSKRMKIKKLPARLCSKSSTVYTCQGDSLTSSYRKKSGERISKSAHGSPLGDLNSCVQRLKSRYVFEDLREGGIRQKKGRPTTGAMRLKNNRRKQGQVQSSWWNGMPLSRRRNGKMARFKVVALCEMSADKVVALSKYSAACTGGDVVDDDNTNKGLDSPNLIPSLEPGEPLDETTVEPIRDGWPLNWHFTECPVKDAPPMPLPNLPNIPNRLYKFNLNVPSTPTQSNVQVRPSCGGHAGEEIYLTLFKNPHSEGDCPVFSEKVTCPTDGSGLDPFLQHMLDSGDYTMFVATDSPSEMAFSTCYNCYYAPVIPIDELATLEPGEPVTSDNMAEYTDGLPEEFDLEMCGDASTISPTGGPRVPQRASASYGFNLQVASGGPGGGMEKVGISSACHGKEGKVYVDIFSNDANEAPMCEFSGAIVCPDGIKFLETLLDSGNYFVAITPEDSDPSNPVDDSPPWELCQDCQTVELMPEIPIVYGENSPGVSMEDGIYLTPELVESIEDGLCDHEALVEAVRSDDNTRVKAFNVAIPPDTQNTLTFKSPCTDPSQEFKITIFSSQHSIDVNSDEEYPCQQTTTFKCDNPNSLNKISASVSSPPASGTTNLDYLVTVQASGGSPSTGSDGGSPPLPDISLNVEGCHYATYMREDDCSEDLSSLAKLTMLDQDSSSVRFSVSNQWRNDDSVDYVAMIYDDGGGEKCFVSTNVGFGHDDIITARCGDNETATFSMYVFDFDSPFSQTSSTPIGTPSLCGSDSRSGTDMCHGKWTIECTDHCATSPPTIDPGVVVGADVGDLAIATDSPTAFPSSKPSVANMEPNAQDDNPGTNEGTPLVEDVLVNDVDPDGDEMTVIKIAGQVIVGSNIIDLPMTLTLPSGALLTVDSSGEYTYDPNGQYESLEPGETTVETFDYTVSDGNDGQDTATVTIIIRGNEPPQLGSGYTGPEVTGSDPITSDLLAGIDDPDSDEPLVLSHINDQTFPPSGEPIVVTLPSGSVITASPDGQYTYDPPDDLDPDEVVVDEIPFEVTDGQGGTATSVLTLTVISDNTAPPTKVPTAGPTVTPGQPTKTPTDKPTQAPTKVPTQAPNAVPKLDPSGYTGPEVTGSDPITSDLLADIDDPDSDEPLVLSHINDQTFPPSGEPIVVTLPSGSVITASPDGQYTYDPPDDLDPDEVVVDEIPFEVTDGQGGTATSVLTLTVISDNTAPPTKVPTAGPTVTPGQPTKTPTDKPTQAPTKVPTQAPNAVPKLDPSGYTGPEVTGSDPITSDLLADIDDPDSDEPLVLSHINDQTFPPSGEPIVVTLPSGSVITASPDGQYTYDPPDDLDPDEVVVDEIPFEVTDGQGGTATSVLTLTVISDNTAPPTKVPTAGPTVTPGQPTKTPTDKPTQAPTKVPTQAPNAVPKLDPSGYTGPEVTGSDPITSDLLADIDDPDSDEPLVLSHINDQTFPPSGEPIVVTLPSGSVITASPDGQYTYDPPDDLDPDEVVVDEIPFEVTDGQGGTATSVLTLTVISDNTAPPTKVPTAGPTVTPGQPTKTPTSTPFVTETIGLSDSDFGETVSPTVTMTEPTFSTNAPTASPNETPAGVPFDMQFGQEFEETISPTILTEPPTKSPTKKGQNPPIAENDSIDPTPSDEPVSSTLLDNDTDPEDDPLTVAKINEEPVEGSTTVSLPTGAILTVDPNGQFTFDPNSQYDSLPPGETATETMEYTVTDGQGGTDVATVTITVSGINDGPDAEDDSESTSPSSPVSSSMFPNDSDAEGDELTVTEVNGLAVDDGATVSLPSGALVTVGTSGQYTYNPNGQFDSLPSNEEGMDTFTYVISDGEGGTDLATVTMVLPGEEDPPMAANDFEETIPGAPLSDNALLNDSDPEDDDLTVIGLGGGEVGVELDLPSGSKVVLQSDGTYDYTPSDSYSDMEHGDSMVDTFGYTISDGTGRTDVATVTIVVHGNNTHPFAEDDSRTTHHDATVTASVLTNDSDPESDKLTVHSVGLDESDPDTAITLPSGAVVSLSAGGTFTYDPNHVFDSLKEDEMGTDTFPYVITDGNGGYATATVTILIPGANDPPVAENDSIDPTPSDEPVSSTLLDNDTDPEDDPLTVAKINEEPVEGSTTVSLPTGAILTVDPNGQFTFDPNSQYDSLPPGETATETMEYTVTDGQGGTDVATVTITVSGINDGPDAEDDSESTSPSSPVSSSMFPNDSDPEGDELTVTEVNGLAVDDGATVSLPSGALVTVGTSGQYTYNPNGQFDSLPSNEEGMDTFTYVISDGEGGTDLATVTMVLPGEEDPPMAANDFEETIPGAPLSDNALLNDSDPEDDDLTVIGLGGGEVGVELDLPSGSKVVLQSDGTYDYTPSDSYSDMEHGDSMVDTFGYTISDGTGRTDVATVTIVVHGNNTHPFAEDDSRTTHHDATVTASVLTNDSDPESDKLTVHSVGLDESDPDTAITLPSGAVVSLSAGGTFTYDPNHVFDSLKEDEMGTDTFPYVITDGNGGYATATVTILIPGANDPPVAENDSIDPTPSDEPVSSTLLDNDTDPEDDPLTVAKINEEPVEGSTTVSLPTGAILTVDPNGQFTFDPNSQYDSLPPGETATETMEYTVTDGQGGTDVATVTITVSGINDGPDAEDDSESTSPSSPVSSSMFPNDSDPEGDELTVTEVNGLAVDDGATVSLPSGALVTVGTSGQYTYNPNGQFDSLPSNEEGMDTFTYVISDGEGGTDLATVTMVLPGEEDPPMAANDFEETIPGAPLSDNALLNDSDPEDDDLTVIGLGGGEVGVELDLPSGSKVVLQSDGTYDYTPSDSYSDMEHGDSMVDTFGYTISDGTGRTDVATVTIVVHGNNTHPFAEDDSRTTHHDATVTASVLTNDSDPESDKLTVHSVGLDESDPDTAITLPSGAVVSLSAGGTFTYDPNHVFDSLKEDEMGTDTFPYVITDGNGGYATATVTILIPGANDPPVAENDSIDPTPSDEPVSSTLLDNDTDPEDDPLTVAKINEEPVEGSTTVSLPTGAILTVDPNGQFTFDPNSQYDSLPPGETATETMEYTVTDGQGGTDVATVTITVSGINDGPDAEDDSESTSPSSPVSSSMFPNDSDPEGDELTVTEVNGLAVDDGATVSLPSGALVTVGTSGQYTYNPNGQFDSLPSNEEGMDTFTYVISDGEGGTDLATVTMVLPGEEDPPMAANDFEETIPGAPLSDNALLNDSDPEDDDLTVIGLGGGEVGVELDLPSGSKVVLQSDGTYDYTPSDSYSDMEHGDSMVDTFEYTISDGTGRTDVATVTIVVHGNNTHPFAEDDSRTTHHDATVTASVLTNDSDPESDKLTVHSVGLDESDPDTAITLPSGAVVSLSAGGTFTYDPNHVFDSLKEDEMGTDTFPYVITDGNGGYATATVTILIPGANDPPVAENDSIDPTPSDEPVSSTLLDNDTDPEDDPLTVAKINEEPVEGSTTVSLPTGAILTVDPNGQFTFDPNSQYDSLPPGETATETMEYTVTDGQGGTDVATVTITVSGINDGPDAEDDSESTSPSSPVSSSMFPNDSDPEGDELTVTEVNGLAVDDGATVSLPSGALVTVGTSGQYTYNPNGQFDSLPSNEEGMDTFTYVISDGEGGTDLATVTMVLPGEEDPPMAANDFEETIPGAPLSDNALLNDSDPEDDDLTVIGLGGGEVGVELDLPSGSKVVLQSDGTYDYTPSDSYSDMEHGDSMVDTFEYTISDGTGRTDVATVTIVVHGNNTHPFAEDDSRTTHHDATVTASVLTNDSDPESDKLTVHSVGLDESDPDTAITLPSGAVVSLSAGGTFTYDPNHVFDSLKEDEMGTDTFPYVITDGNGGYATATVTILIPGANDPPVAENDSIDPTPSDEPVSSTLLDNDTDPEDDPLTVAKINEEPVEGSTTVSLPTGAILTVDPNGQFTFDPNSQYDSLPPGETATETMEYTVTDGQGGTDVATVTITIVGSSDVDPQGPSISGTDSPTIAPEPSVVASDTPSTSPTSTSSAPSHLNVVAESPSATPSAMPSSAPWSSLEAPSSMPSATPQPVVKLVGELPSAAPSSMPSAAPEPFVVTLVGESPSAAPSSMPSAAPEPFVVTLVGESPSAAPSSMPSAAPEPFVVTLVGESPSAAPSSMPSAAPEPFVVTLVGESPSAAPSSMPSAAPEPFVVTLVGESPSAAPSSMPSAAPEPFVVTLVGESPSAAPSSMPSAAPEPFVVTLVGESPSAAPSSMPSAAPEPFVVTLVGELTSGSPSAVPTAMPSSMPQTTIRALLSSDVMCRENPPDCTKDWSDEYTHVTCSKETPCFMTADCKCSNENPCEGCLSGSICQNNPALLDYDPSKPTMCINIAEED